VSGLEWMKARFVALIATFVALISVSSAFAHTIAWVGHPTIGAIIVTFLYLTAFGVSDRLGVTSIIGLLTGVVNSLIFASLFSIPVHFVRGAVFDLFFFVSCHKLCCRRCAIASGVLSFYVTMIVIYTLYATFGLTFTSWWIWFILAGIPSTVLTIPGSLLALKYKERIRGAFMRGGA